MVLFLPLLIYFPALNEDVQACIDISGDYIDTDIELTFIKRSLGTSVLKAFELHIILLLHIGTGLCETAQTLANVIVLNGTSTPKACFNISNTDDRTFQLFFTTNVIGVHLGNQQAIATLDYRFVAITY